MPRKTQSGPGPWLKFYVDDYRNDPGLRTCSLAARGLWVEMLCVMHRAETRGYFLINGSQPTSSQVAIMVGATEKEVSQCLDELASTAVFSVEKRGRKKGVIFSRRMVRDEKQRRSGRENGKLGGNVSLSKQREKRQGVNPHLQKGVNPPPIYQKSDHQNDDFIIIDAGVRPDAVDDDGGGSRGWDRKRLENLETRLRTAAGLQNAVDPALCDVSPIVELINAGVNLEVVILPTVLSVASRAKRPPRSWQYFVQAINDAVERNRQGAANIVQLMAPKTDVDDATWQRRLRMGAERKVWPRAEFGPAPGEDGYAGPDTDHDGQGWIDDVPAKREVV
ncbi:MAG: hypothetical protein AAF619_13140 [Pseudomonadota bacterium]